MPSEPLLDAVQTAFDAVSRRPRDLLLDDRLMEDLELDSVEVIEFVAELESRLGVPLLDDPTFLLDVRSVGDLVDAVARAKGSRELPGASSPAPS